MGNRNILGKMSPNQSRVYFIFFEFTTNNDSLNIHSDDSVIQSAIVDQMFSYITSFNSHYLSEKVKH